MISQRLSAPVKFSPSFLQPFQCTIKLLGKKCILRTLESRKRCSKQWTGCCCQSQGRASSSLTYFLEAVSTCELD